MNRYGRPTTYKRITPKRGSGFILKRIYDLTEAPGMEHAAHPRKIDVYLGTPWYKYPGWSSLLWSSLIKDGLIESDDGMQDYKYYSFYMNPHVGTRAAGHYAHNIGYTVRYHLTPKGRGILFDMMDRVGAKGKVLNSVGSVAEHDAKKDAIPDPPPTPIERDILEKEAVDCAKLAADYVGENQKLRAEKNDVNERLKKIRERLIAIGNETDLLQGELQQLIDWSSSNK